MSVTTDVRRTGYLAKARSPHRDVKKDLIQLVVKKCGHVPSQLLYWLLSEHRRHLGQHSWGLIDDFFLFTWRNEPGSTISTSSEAPRQKLGCRISSLVQRDTQEKASMTWSAMAQGLSKDPAESEALGELICS